MQVRFWAQTDVGRQRDHNEDSFLVDKRLNLFICCDGMGGHAAGEVASSAAVHEVRKYLSEKRDVLEKFASDHAMVDRRDLLQLMENAVHHACARVHQLAQIDVRRRGMGTTLVALLVCGDRGFIAHVGDSRVYLLRQQQIHQLTEDHSLVNELIRRGKLKPGQDVALPYKNAVTRAVGVYQSVEVDTLDFDLMPGDRYLLASDGLTGYLDEQDEDVFLDMFQADDLNVIPQVFIDFANAAGGKDNVTAVIVEMTEEHAESEEPKTAEIQLKLDTLHGIPLFKYLTYKELVKLLNITHTSDYEAGDTVMKEGDTGDAFYVTLEGQLTVLKGDTEVASLEQGTHFGEMAMVDRSPRSASVIAKVPTRLLSVHRDTFYELLRKDPQLAVKLVWSFVQVLTVRLRRSTTELAQQLSEHEIIERMEPLFDAVSPRGTSPNMRIQSAEEPSEDALEALDEDAIVELEDSEDVMATQGTYDVLRLAARETRTGAAPPPPPEAALTPAPTPAPAAAASPSAAAAPATGGTDPGTPGPEAPDTDPEALLATDENPALLSGGGDAEELEEKTMPSAERLKTDQLVTGQPDPD